MKERYVDSGLLSGIHTQVWRRGELAHNGMAGPMDIERGKPWREDAIVRIYSMTKPITAVALMMLVEEGKLGLDDAVHTHIPSWKNLRVYQSAACRAWWRTPPASSSPTPCKRPMKVVDLVTHTSGLTYGFMSRTAVDAEYRKQKINDFQTPGGLDAFIEQLSKIPLDFSPGENWNYSVSIDVMGYLVQKLSGMTFGEFLRTRLFEPLGMKDTAFSVPASKMDRFASCYMPKPGGGLQLPGRCRQVDLCRAAQAGIRRRRPGLDRARLHALLPHDAGRRHAGRRADPVAQDGADVRHEPSARRQAAQRHRRRRRACSARPAITASASPSAAA